jgi:hypothetical protein
LMPHRLPISPKCATKLRTRGVSVDMGRPVKEVTGYRQARLHLKFQEFVKLPKASHPVIRVFP